MTVSGNTQMIGSVECYPIDGKIEDAINDFASQSENPKYVLQYVNVTLNKEKEEKRNLENGSVVEKVTQSEPTPSSQSTPYTAQNLRVSEAFMDELRSGNWVYNIIHLLPTLGKASFDFLKKLSGKLVSSSRAKKTIEEVRHRLDDLEDEELETLMEEYEDAQVEMNMNDEIHRLVRERLARYQQELEEEEVEEYSHHR